MKGATEDDKREGKVKISDGASDSEIAGEELDAEVEVHEVLKLEYPKLTATFLEELGDFESEEELRDFVRDSLERQADYRTQQALRSSVIDALSTNANFELPKSLVARQTQRELERKVLELRRSNFPEDDIRRYVNSLRQNAESSTIEALRQHFILEKIAEEEEVDADAADYDAEIALIAQQSDVPERRVRSRLEKSGQMDALRNQIVERKVIEMVVDEAKLTENKVKSESDDESDEFAVYHEVVPVKDHAAIPEAKYDDDNKPKDDDQKDKEKD